MISSKQKMETEQVTLDGGLVGQKEPEISESRLRELYLEQSLSIDNVAKRVGVRYQKVKACFQKYGIETRDSYETYKLNNDVRYRDETFLRENYISEEKSIADIASMCGCSTTTVRDYLKKYDILRGGGEIRFWIAGYRGNDTMDYPMVSRTGDGGYAYIHHLVVIADGEDPEIVFGDNEYNVHHKNGHKCDNRPSNLELINRVQHGKKHVHNDHLNWSDDDLESVVKMMLNPSRFIG